MNKNQLIKLISVCCFVHSGNMIENRVNAQVKLGVFADCQYCDCEPHSNRYYRNSLSKLSVCIEEFNKHDLDFVVGLGDLIDRDYSSFEKVNAVLNDSKNKIYQVIGNHDFVVDDNLKNKVPSTLNLSKNYYTVLKNDWLFIFLNGNEISLQSTDEKTISKAEQILAELNANLQPNNKDWNGALGKMQINWLEKQLKTAEKQNKKVVIFCHYPLLPLEAHTLWDSVEALSVLQKYKGVKAWINGHNHAGNYVGKNGIHFITMQGMVDTEARNAYSIIYFEKEEIKIIGFGRETNRTLSIKK